MFTIIYSKILVEIFVIIFIMMLILVVLFLYFKKKFLIDKIYKLRKIMMF